MTFPGFGISETSDNSFRECFGECPFLFNIWKILRRISICSFCTFRRIHLWGHLVLDAYFYEIFPLKIQISFHLLWSVCSNYLFLPNSILVDSMFLEICPFLLGCQIYWHIIIHSILLCFVIFLQYQLLLLIFHFIWVLSLYFLVTLVRGFLSPGQISFPFQRISSWFYWFFFYCFLNLYFIYFLSDLYYFLPSADLRFCSSFSNSFQW